jgi:hypothetical protein
MPPFLSKCHSSSYCQISELIVKNFQKLCWCITAIFAATCVLCLWQFSVCVWDSFMSDVIMILFWSSPMHKNIHFMYRLVGIYSVLLLISLHMYNGIVDSVIKLYWSLNLVPYSTTEFSWLPQHLATNVICQTHSSSNAVLEEWIFRRIQQPYFNRTTDYICVYNTYIHSFSSLSHDRSKAFSKASSPHSAI